MSTENFEVHPVGTGAELQRLRYLAALLAAPGGWVMVPVKPTREMWDAVNKLDDQCAAGNFDGKGCSIEQAWDCLLAAAPQQPAPQPLTDEQKDAARYRWLRDGCNEKGSRASHIAANFYGMEWDAAIDDAIRRAHGIGEQP